MGDVSDVLQELDVTINPILICSVVTLQNMDEYTAPPVNEGDPKFCATGQREGSDACLVSEQSLGYTYNVHGIMT